MAKLAWDPRWRVRSAEKYSQLRRLIGLAHFALSIAAIALGWGWVVNERFQPAPFAELLVPLPYLVGVFLAWILHYDAERTLHRATLGPTAPFWSRGGHFINRLRPYLLLVLLPATLFAAQQSFMRYFPESGRSEVLQWLMLALGPVLFLLMPLIAKPALGFKSMPPGRHRERLEATARRLASAAPISCSGPPTAPSPTPWCSASSRRRRYVVFTDRLLDELDDDELDAVFGHEIGHVRHGHLLYYAAFLMLSMMLIFVCIGGLTMIGQEEKWITPEQAESVWLATFSAAFAGYLFLVFGFMSRKCERQADLFGVRTVASTRTEGHPQAAGVYAMTRALDKVALLNGLENSYGDGAASTAKRLRQRIISWQHGSIADRLEFLYRTLEDEHLEARVQRRITAFRWLMLAGLVAGLIALGFVLGWSRLAAML